MSPGDLSAVTPGYSLEALASAFDPSAELQHRSVHSKAVQPQTQPAAACLYALDPSAQGAFSISGSTSISTSCSAVVESSGSQAYQMSGSEILYVQNNAQVGVVGGWSLSGSTKIVNQSTGQTVSPVKITSPGDPLAFLPVPTGGTIIGRTHTNYDMNNKPPNNTLSAGIYCGGLTIGNTNGATFTMSAGTYVMAGGGLTINSQAVVSGAGVTVYNTSSTGWGCSGSSSYTPLTISGQAVVTLSAPTTGALADVVFFGDRNGCSTLGSCQDQINGSSSTTINGAMYFKSDTLLFTGSNSNGCMMAVADKLNFNGNTSFGITGCSGTIGGVTVSVSPTSATLYGGQSQQFTATVTNASNTAVTWSISPVGVGSVNSSGLYTAPASITSQQTVSVTATSQAESTVSASATVTLMPPVSVSVAPPTATLYGGQTQQFAATVSNTSNTAVNWSISPSVGSISTSGLYTAPASITTQQNVTVTATSQAYPSASASATVHLMPPVSVAISPTSASILPGQTQQFTATVANTSNTAVTWSINPTSTGTINSSGLYTAPATITQQQSVTVTATSQADTTKSASASVTITIPLPTITNITSPVTPGSQVTITGQNFLSTTGTVTLNGVAIPTMSWSSTSITLTAPASNNCTGPVTVTTQYGTSNTVTLTITGTQSGCLYPPPTANAGPAQTVPVGATVQLDGTRSTDQTGTQLTYSWSFVSIPSGSAATLSDPTSPKPTFVADVYGNYQVQLVVNDSYHNSAPSQVIISTQDSAPVANAGPNQTVPTSTLVQLDGSKSTDVDGQTLTYSWTFSSMPVGSKATLSNPTSVNPTFTTDKKGTYVVQLVVNDGILNSAPSTVSIGDVNTAPVANAGPNQSVNVGATVQLNGSGSTDVDGDTLTYRWSFTSIPTGSSAVLSSTTIVNPTFVADVPGNYVVQLIVNDGTVDSMPSTLTIGNSDIAPIANAGPPQTVTLGAQVTLDGSASTDSDNKPLTYQWSLLSVPTGSTATLAQPNSPNPTFTADLAGNYVAQLIVNDGFLNSQPSTVTISTSHSVPVANAGPNQTVTVGATVQLTGAASYDVDGYPLTYKWSLTSQPTGGTAVLSSTTVVNPTFVANAVGAYVAQLIVNDGVYDSTPVTVMITANPPNQAPVVNAGANQSITLPTNTVTLNGTVTDDGLPNNTLIISWTQFSGPGTVTFSSPSTAVTQATFSAAGTYVLQLSANDTQYTTTSQTTVTVNPPANQPPVVNAGASQTITLPTNSVTLNGTATDDGLPNGTLVIAWSFISGPGTVTFSSSTTAVTTATFSSAGTYVLQLSANDSQYTSYSQVTVTVKPAPANQPPAVSAGPNQSITLPTTTVTLNGTATDDGLPNGTLTVAWTQISGPTTAVFSSPNTAVTQATFNAIGLYVLQLSANDGQYTSTSQVSVYVYTQNSTGQNQPPYVNAGPDQTVLLPASALLDGVAVDDGLPSGTLAVQWTALSGPGTVTFSSPTTAVTQASFSMAGTYVLQLAASDSVLVSNSNVTITVGKLSGHASNSGTDFWLMFPADYLSSGQPQLIISSDVNNSGVITIPGLAYSQTFTLVGGQATTINLPVTALMATTDIVENKGIHVTAQSEINIYAIDYATYATDGYLGLPTPVLGTDYVVPAWQNFNAQSEIALTAAYDATTVTITPAVTSSGRVAGQPYTVVLNQGRTYELVADMNGYQNDLTGTIVTSDKPIAVWGGNECANVPTSAAFCNHILEEIPPTNLWGESFVTFPLINRPNGDFFRILAASDGTNISMNGTPLATLNRGEFYQTVLTTASTINSDKPILVVQYETSESYQPESNNQQGDPSMIIVPPYEQYGGHYTVGTPLSNFNTDYVNVVVPTNAVNTVQMDGAAVTASNFSAIGTSAYSGASVQITPGTHRFTAAAPFGVTLYGYLQYDTFGYQAGMVLDTANPGTSITMIPTTVTQLTGTQLCAISSVLDPYGAPVGGIGVGFTVTGANISSQSVDTNYTGQASYCYTGTSSGTDTIVASVGLASTTSTITWNSTAPNRAPAVYAGANQTINLPASANLFGAVSDDGLPTGNMLSVSWTQVSGPGTVTFAHANQAVTTATFSSPGTYDLRLTANDSQLTGSADVTVVAVTPPPNQAPVVSAGPDQSTTLPNSTVTLNGSITDDGLPANAKLTAQWTQVSGPSGYATFSNSSSPLTQVTFTTAGTYVFQLTGDDSQYTTSSQVTVTVSPLNRPPQLSCGAVPQLTLPVNSTMLNCTVTDDGFPVGATVTQTWSQLTGPATATIANPTQSFTQVTFPVAGTYTLQLTATDTQLTAWTGVQVTVNPASQPPTVTINPASQTITLPTNTATLTGTVTDSALPAGGSLTQLWTLQSGPAGVTFGSPTATTTTVTFTAAGTYYFILTASNSQMVTSATASVTVAGGVTVTNPNQAPVVSAGFYNSISLPTNSLTLTPYVSDDGLPNNTLTVAWTQVNGPAPVTFTNPNQASTSVTFPIAGTYQLRLTVSDSQLTSTSDTYIAVNPSDSGPKITFNPNYIGLILPNNSTTLTASVNNNSGASLSYNWLVYTGPGPVTFSTPTSLTTDATFSVAGVYGVQLMVSDGQVTSIGTLTVEVFPSAPAAPQVILNAPQDGQTITAPLQVLGSVLASSQNSGTGLLPKWTLDYSLNTADGASTQNWIHLVSPNQSVPQNNTVLGTIDPTVLLNGSYTLRLSVTDSYGQSATTSTTFTISKNMKVGNFRLTYNDLTVPVAGIPITVTRIYDSLDSGFHDFGTSWSLGISNVRVEKNRNLGKSWTERSSGGGFSSYCVQSLNSKVVTITFPDNTQYNFQANSTPQCQQIAPLTAITVGFTELPGSPGTAGATLVPADGGQVLFDGTVPGDVNLVDYNGNPYNPTTFILTTRDGMRYTIDQTLGVTSMSDANGNSLTINAGGVISSTGKSITFTRDSSNRITQITDPNGNVLKYAYSGTGVTGLLYQFTDASNNTTNYSYTYNGVSGLPYLQLITDPRGIRPITQYYDAAGHIFQTVDANGKLISYSLNESAQKDVITDRLGNVTTYSYDADGNILSMTDGVGNTTTYTYDANDNKLTETNALGKTTTYTYDGNSNRTSVTDPLGNKTTYTYNARGQVLTVTDPQGRTTTNVYDNNGNLTFTTDANGKTTGTSHYSNGQPQTITDANGKTTSLQYDGSGNLTQQTDALNNVTTYTYDANNNKLSQTVTRTVNGQPQSITTNYKYDASNRLTETDYADGTKTQVQYNSIGKQSVTIDQLGHQTSYAYDSMGRLTATTHSDNTTDSATFDAENDRLTSTDRANHTTTFAYDADKRLTRTTYADNSFTQTNYDAAGRVSSTVDANGNSTTYGYDDAGRRTTLTDAQNHATTFAYDASGNQTSVKDARGNTTQYQYDTLNRQTAVIYPDQTTSTTVYDPLGRVASNTDPAGKVTVYGYDDLGRLTSVTQDAVQGGLNLVTHYGYDEVGNRISQTDANGHATTYSYDQLGRRIGRTLPAGQSESYTYDSNGNLKTKTDFNGKITTYSYDSSNRLLSKTPDASFNAPVVSFTYMVNGLRQTMSDVSGTTTYGYDNRNRLTSKQTPFGTLIYTYDAAGDLLTLASSNTNGVSLTYTYDTLNRLSTVTDNRLIAQGAVSGVTTYGYDAVGNLQNFTYPNGVTHAYTYDPLNRLTQVGSSKDASAISNYAYTLGTAGNRTAVTELSGRTIAYVYDSLYRLTSETVTADPNNHNGAISYTYDSVGNRKTLTSTLAPVGGNTYNYDADDRLASDQYDAEGNTTNSGGTANTYDFENHLITHGAVTVVYDGDGNRVSETVGNVTTNYLVDTVNPTGYAQVVDELVSGNVAKTYAYGLERIDQNWQPTAGTWRPAFYGYDGHGSVRQLTNFAGAVTDSYDYDAFGNLITSTGSTPNNYLFAGEQYDPALGLYYNRARYLNTTTGRFWSMDSYEGEDEIPLSLHKYLYVQGNPVDGADPSGYTLADILYGQRVHDEIGAAFLRWTGGPPLGLYDPTIKQILGRSVPGFSRFRPDLVDLRTNEVYEIKPVSASVLGYQQLGGYLIILNLSDPLHRLWIPGETFQPPDLPTTIQLDPNTVALVDPPLLGLITYEVLNANELLAWGTLTVAGAVAASEADLELSVGVATLNTSLAPGAP